MRKAVFTAQLKKVEVVNKVPQSENADPVQCMRVILEDVEIDDESLVLLRRFRPGNSVHVIVSPFQLELQDVQVEAAVVKEQSVAM